MKLPEAVAEAGVGYEKGQTVSSTLNDSPSVQVPNDAGLEDERTISNERLERFEQRMEELLKRISDKEKSIAEMLEESVLVRKRDLSGESLEGLPTRAVKEERRDPWGSRQHRPSKEKLVSSIGLPSLICRNSLFLSLFPKHWYLIHVMNLF